MVLSCGRNTKSLDVYLPVNAAIVIAPSDTQPTFWYQPAESTDSSAAKLDDAQA